MKEIGTTSLGRPVPPVHHHRHRGDGDEEDSTEVMRVRESVERNKISLIVCTLLAIVGVIGWLSSL